MPEEGKTDSESSCLLFEKEKRFSEKNENSCKFVCVYSSLFIITNYFRSFVSRAGWSAQNDGVFMVRLRNLSCHSDIAYLTDLGRI